MPLENWDALLKRLKRTPLMPLNAASESFAFDRTAIEGMLPHRGSMLLLDSIAEVDRDRRTLRAQRQIAATDPVFADHFPGGPVYPGVLLVEMMGQAGLCLLPLVEPESSIRLARLARVHHATFLAPVLPDTKVTVLAALLEESLTFVAAGQVFVGEKLCAYAVSEVYVDG